MELKRLVKKVAVVGPKGLNTWQNLWHSTAV